MWLFGVELRIAWRRLSSHDAAMAAANSFIQCRVTDDTKERFRRIAERADMTASAKLHFLVNRCIDESDGPAAALYPRLNSALGRPKGERLYLRLHAADRLLLKERAAARGMKEASYLAMLVRAHVRALTPLPIPELRALQISVAELRVVGRNLNQIARAVNEGRSPDRSLRSDAMLLITVCERLRDHVKALIQSNLISWESGHVQARR